MEVKKNIAEIFNELNDLALQAESPEPLIKWAIVNFRYLVPCVQVSIALTRFDTVLFVTGGIHKESSDTARNFVDTFRSEIKNELNANYITSLENIYFELDDVGLERNKNVSSGERLHMERIVAKDKLVGFLRVESLAAIPKYRKNLINSFCNQLGLGLRNLIDRSVVLQQTAMLEQEAKRTGEEKKKVDAIVGGMSEGIMLIGADDTILTVNDAARAMMGLPYDFEAKDVTRFIVGKFAEIQELKKDKQSIDWDVEITRPEYKVIRVSITPIRNDAGESLGKAVMLMDITKEREVDRMKSEFVSSVSHELRTPLTSIREALALIKDGLIGDVTEKQDRCLDVALMDVDRLTRIINDLLNLSRMESGKIKIARSPTNVAYLLDYVVRTMGPKAKSGQVTLGSDCEGELPDVYVDSDQIIQVITNLVGNALKFTPADGKVSLIAKQHDGEYISIGVRDTGPGISKSEQKKLFEKFVQLDSGLTRQTGGTGLGLAISKEIVLRHSGKVWIDSAPGKGSTFYFSVPVYSEQFVYIQAMRDSIEIASRELTEMSVILLKPPSGGFDLRSFIDSIKSNMRNSDDKLMKHDDKFLFLILRSPKEIASSVVSRLIENSGAELEWHVASYPEDGNAAEELWNIIGPHSGL